jgi:hypothetical protein
MSTINPSAVSTDVLPGPGVAPVKDVVDANFSAIRNQFQSAKNDIEGLESSNSQLNDRVDVAEENAANALEISNELVDNVAEALADFETELNNAASQAIAFAGIDPDYQSWTTSSPSTAGATVGPPATLGSRKDSDGNIEILQYNGTGWTVVMTLTAAASAISTTSAATYSAAKPRVKSYTNIVQITGLGTFERTTATVTGATAGSPESATQHDGIYELVFETSTGVFVLFRRKTEERITVPLGLSDYAAFFRKALDFNLKLHLKNGTYPILSKIEEYLDYGDIDWIADGRAVLDTSTLLAADAIGFRVLSNSSTVNLANNIAEGARTINTTFAGLQPGDWIRIAPHPARIAGGNAELWTAARNYYYKGELNQVISVVGSTITLAKPARDSYTALNGASQQNYILERVRTTKVRLKNIHFKRNANAMCAEFNRCEIEFENVTSEGGRECGIQFYYCRGKSINGGGTDAWYSGTGQSYVGALASCEDFTLEGGSYNSGRHGITTGGNEPCRNITIRNLEAFSHPSAATQGLDCHENSDHIIFENVRTNGVAMMGRNLKLKNAAIISGLAGDVIGIIATKSGGDYEIDNVEILGAINGTSVNFQFGLNNITADTLKIRGLKTKERTGIGVFLTAEGRTGCFINDIDINAQIRSAIQAVASFANFPAGNFKLTGTCECTGDNHAVMLNFNTAYTVVTVEAVIRHLATNQYDALQIQNALMAIVEKSDINTSVQNSARAAIRLTDTEQFRVEKNVIRNAVIGVQTSRSVLTTTRGTVKDNLYSGNASDRNAGTGTTMFNMLTQLGVGISNRMSIATIPSGQSSVVVTHGLGYAPGRIQLTPRANVGPVWATAIGASQFTLNVPSAVGADTIIDYWIE